MNLPRLGYATVVNNVSKEMPGSNADVAAPKAVYERVGLEVRVHTNCNSQVKIIELCLVRFDILPNCPFVRHRRQSRFSEIPCLNSFICLKIAKILTFYTKHIRLSPTCA